MGRGSERGKSAQHGQRGCRGAMGTNGCLWSTYVCMRERTEKEQAGNHRSFELRATTRARTQENFRKLGEWDRTRSRRNIFDNGYFYFLREAGGGVGVDREDKEQRGSDTKREFA